MDNGTIIGTGLLGIRGSMGWIGGMGVVPGRRRQGIGRQMMLYLLDRAREELDHVRTALEKIKLGQTLENNQTKD
jgi:GNAT superfamily N-acetyltransferase